MSHPEPLIQLVGIEVIDGEPAWLPPPVPPELPEAPLLDEANESCGTCTCVSPSPSGRFTFREDIHQVWGTLWNDTRAIANWHNAALLGVVLGGSLAVRATLDDDVRENTARHEARWGKGTQFFESLGEPYVQWPAWAGLYGWSLYRQDPQLHDLSQTLFNAMALTSVSTTIIKGIADTHRPSDRSNGGHYGFPSYHAASSFTIAAVIDEYYGPKAGVPAYIVAGLIGWSRIDSRDHDLSDVLFGSALGYLIGKGVARQHLYGDGRVRLCTWYEPWNRANGVKCEVPF